MNRNKSKRGYIIDPNSDMRNIISQTIKRLFTKMKRSEIFVYNLDPYKFKNIISVHKRCQGESTSWRRSV